MPKLQFLPRYACNICGKPYKVLHNARNCERQCVERKHDTYAFIEMAEKVKSWVLFVEDGYTREFRLILPPDFLPVTIRGDHEEGITPGETVLFLKIYCRIPAEVSLTCMTKEKFVDELLLLHFRQTSLEDVGDELIEIFNALKTEFLRKAGEFQLTCRLFGIIQEQFDGFKVPGFKDIVNQPFELSALDWLQEFYPPIPAVILSEAKSTKALDYLVPDPKILPDQDPLDVLVEFNQNILKNFKAKYPEGFETFLVNDGVKGIKETEVVLLSTEG